MRKTFIMTTLTLVLAFVTSCSATPAETANIKSHTAPAKIEVSIDESTTDITSTNLPSNSAEVEKEVVPFVTTTPKEVVKEEVIEETISVEKDAPTTLFLAKTTDLVNFRTKPNLNSKVITKLNPGTKVVVQLEKVGEFYRATCEGKTGYIYSTYVDVFSETLYAIKDTTYKVNNKTLKISAGETITVYKNFEEKNILEDASYIKFNKDNFATEASYKKAMLDSADKELISTYTTYYSLEEEYAGKAFNINRACGEVTCIIPAGEDFNWHVIVGNTNYAEGYALANVYAGGKTIKGYGGGVCQVSSTIYNNVLNLDLTVVERHPHGLPVTYVDWENGRDSAVDDIGGFNFIFTNNKDYDIYIEAYTDIEPNNEIDTQGVLTVNFYKLTY